MEAPETQQSGLPNAGQTKADSTEANIEAASPPVNGGRTEEARRTFGARRKLSDEQEREVTQLYAESRTPVEDIARRFGIAESFVYRVAQRHGGQLRSRVQVTAQPEQEVSTASPVPEVRPVRSRPPKPPGGGTRTFRIRFEVEEVLQAVDVRDAIRQAESRGITHLTAVSRED